MDLLNENQYKKKEQSTGKKVVLVLLILSILSLIGIIILMMYLESNKTVGNTLYINDQQQPIAEELIIEDTEGTQYIELEEIAKAFGYQFDNSEYQKYGVDTTKCYIRNNKLISGFELDSNKIYKYEIGTNLDYQYYTLKHKIIAFKGKLYVAIEDLAKSLNVYCTMDQNKVIKINTIEYLIDVYKEKLKDTGYTLAEDQNNQKALAYGWVVVSKNGVWSVLNTELEEIIGAKYSSIYFDEINLNYIVASSNGQYGMITAKNGTIAQPLKYDGLEPLNYKNKFYKVKSNNKYGIMKSDGTMLTGIIYDEIGYQPDPTNKILYTLIVPPLDEKSKETIVVKQNEKYGLIYLDNGETFLPCDHLEKLYSVNELGQVIYKIEAEKKTTDLLSYLQWRNLITVNIH